MGSQEVLPSLEKRSAEPDHSDGFYDTDSEEGSVTLEEQIRYTDTELVKMANNNFTEEDTLPAIRFFNCPVPCTHQSHYKWLSEPKHHLPYSFTNSQENWKPFNLPWSPYQHPLYQTTNNVYGAIPSRLPNIPNTFHGKTPNFSMSYRKVEIMERCGMFKNYGFNTSLDRSKVYDEPKIPLDPRITRHLKRTR